MLTVNVKLGLSYLNFTNSSLCLGAVTLFWWCSDPSSSVTNRVHEDFPSPD